MNSHPVVVLLLIFLAAFLAAYAGMASVVAPRARSRLQRLAQGAGEAPAVGDGHWNVVAIKVARSLARLSVPGEGWENSPLRVRFMNAGLRDRSALAYYYAAKTLLVFALPGAGFLYLGPVAAHLGVANLLLLLVLLAALGYYAPNAWLAREIRHRQRLLFEAFPDAIDLLTICVEAGLGLNAAIARVGEEVRVRCPALADEFHLAELELRAGATRENALRNIALRTGLDEVNSLVSMLVQAERFGTSIAQSLRVHSDLLRNERRLRAEEAAAKIPLKLLFPLIFCVFPSLLLVLMGPAMLRVFHALLPSLGGG